MRILSTAILALALDPRLGGAAQDGKDFGKLPYEGALSILGTIPQVDVSRILTSWKILGVLACPTILGGVHACLLLENA